MASVYGALSDTITKHRDRNGIKIGYKSIQCSSKLDLYKNVSSSRRKVISEIAVRTNAGRLFQTREVVTRNARLLLQGWSLSVQDNEETA